MGMHLGTPLLGHMFHEYCFWTFCSDCLISLMITADTKGVCRSCNMGSVPSSSVLSSTMSQDPQFWYPSNTLFCINLQCRFVTDSGNSFIDCMLNALVYCWTLMLNDVRHLNEMYASQGSGTMEN